MLISNAPEVNKLPYMLFPTSQIKHPYMNLDPWSVFTNSGTGYPSDANIASPKITIASKQNCAIMTNLAISFFSFDAGYSSPVTKTFSGEVRSSQYLICKKVDLYPHDMQYWTFRVLNWLRSVFLVRSFTIAGFSSNSPIFSKTACPWGSIGWVADYSFASPLNHILKPIFNTKLNNRMNNMRYKLGPGCSCVYAGAAFGLSC